MKNLLMSHIIVVNILDLKRGLLLFVVDLSAANVNEWLAEAHGSLWKSHKGSSINYVITFGGLGRPTPPYVIL